MSATAIDESLVTPAPVIGPHARFFDDFQVGDSWKSGCRTVTEADLVAFTSYTGDNSAIHTDAEYARSTVYGERLLHGSAGFAIAIGLEARLGIKEGTAIAFLGMSWNILGPIRIGDTLHVRQKVAAVRKTSNSGRGIVTFHVKLVNQKNEEVQEGEWKVMMTRSPPKA